MITPLSFLLNTGIVMDYNLPMADPGLKQTTLETFQTFLNKYEAVSKKAFDFHGETLFPSEIHTLDFIRSHSGTFVSRIAKETGITRGAVSKITLKLKKKKLIVQTADPRNRSRQILKITSKGERICQAHDVHHKEKDRLFHAFFDAVDNADMTMIKELFKMMNAWMDHYM